MTLPQVEGTRSSDASLQERCNVHLYSETQGLTRVRANNYLAWRLGFPDKGSKFERKLGAAKYAFRLPIVNIPLAHLALTKKLLPEGYNALLIERAGALSPKFIGEIAYQLHGSGAEREMHVFSVRVHPDYEGHKLGSRLQDESIAVARMQGIPTWVFGEGNNDAAKHMFRRYTKQKDDVTVVGANTLRILD
ncbi:MAG: GNAT family N-acetyltransferase [Candidatus Woesearchaeota archaeon]|nr:GNAT family N-acetyltransferase [Candidatus Woesearchaeota archaeon]